MLKPRIYAFALLSCLLQAPAVANDISMGDIVSRSEADYYQMDPVDRAADARVLQEKEELADSSARILATISSIEEQIEAIDRDLARYDAPEARNILLAERSRLFRKRREYLRLVAGYQQRQSRMTQSLVQDRTESRQEGEWSLDGRNGMGGVVAPDWNADSDRRTHGKTFLKVENERNMREVAESISRRIYGEYRVELYADLLAANHGNSINPNNLVHGDTVFIPYRIAMLTMMGMQQHGIIEATVAVREEIRDPELKRQILEYAMQANRSTEARDAFVDALVALKQHGENSQEFREALSRYLRVNEAGESRSSEQLIITRSDSDALDFTGTLRDRLVVVSSASYQLDMLPADTQEKVRTAAREYRTLQNRVRTLGRDHADTRAQYEVFETAVNQAYEGVSSYRDGGAITRVDRFSVEADTSGSLSQANALVGLRREVREINTRVLQLVQDVVDTVGSGWTAEGTWWENLTETHKKEASERLFELTNTGSESSRVAQILNRLKMVYASADRYSVELYRDSNFATLRKNMIATIGMAMAIEQIQPSWWSRSDGQFRDLNSTSALQRLGIDVDRKMYYDRGTGAKPQYARLYENNSEKLALAEGLRTRWLDGLRAVAALSAGVGDQDRMASTVTDTRRLFEDVSGQLNRNFTGSIIGTGAGVGAAGLTLFAIANFWNPVGWVAGATIVGGAALTGLAIGNQADQEAAVRAVEQYGDLKIISEMGLLATERDNVRLVEGMLYLDEIVKGY